MNSRKQTPNMEDNDFKVVVDKAIEHLYQFYKCDHSMRISVSLRPSEPWHDIPEELLTKEQFVAKVASGGEWGLAASVLIDYIARHDRDME